jgi:hypothetical protein
MHSHPAALIARAKGRNKVLLQLFEGGDKDEAQCPSAALPSIDLSVNTRY